MSPEDELELIHIRKLVLTLHEADNRLNFELFYGNEFFSFEHARVFENARVFVSPEKITDEEFFKVIKGIMLACQKLLEKHGKEKS